MAEKRESEANGGADANGKKAKMDFGESGTLLFSGATDWDSIGRKTQNLSTSPNTVWGPVRLAALEKVKVRFVSSGPCSAHLFAVTDEGHVYGWGRNEKGQLGLGHTKDRKCPTLVSELTGHNVVAVATGKNHSLFLTDDGLVFGTGDNKAGQVVGGKGTSMVKTPCPIVYDGAPATRVACGQDFSAIVDGDGDVWTWGHPEHGQLGNNTDGGHIEKAGKMEFHCEYAPRKIFAYIEKDPKTKKSTPVAPAAVKEISCGANHTVVVDARNRAFSWGFGGYGRLGHAATDNEMLPRLIKFFDGPRRGIRNVVSGGCFNIAISEIPGMSYMWGQYQTNKEANMYPKPVNDLSGWNVRSIGCSGKGWMVAADDSTIACCGSPCYGELAMGENKKSSAQPVEVKTLNGVWVIKTGMGLSHSVFITRSGTDAEAKKVEKYEVLDQSSDDK